MKNYKQFFKGKKITVMGLGLLGRGVGYTKFLAECGADLIVTDLKTKEQLKASVEEIKNYELRIKNKNSNKIRFVLGEHRLEDFRNRDMIIKAAGVPIDSIYIREAEKNKIPVEMDVSLFAKLAPFVMIIGVTGTRGKSITTTLIYKILYSYTRNKSFTKKFGNIYLGGNLRGVATLPLLKKVKAGDILVCELDSWQLQGFGQARFSPHISVFTSFMPDHMNYYKDSMKEYFKDKANIFKYQKENDILIIRPGMKEFIKKKDTKGKLIVIDTKDIFSWSFNVPGEHHRENMACAVAVARELGIPELFIKEVIEDFKDLEGRLQLLRTYKGIKIYNDNNATTPEATVAGIEALVKPKISVKNEQNKPIASDKKLILICGGSDKKLPLDNLIRNIDKYCKYVVFIPGTGTDRLIKNYKLRIKNEKARDLKDAIKKSLAQVKKGDIILFSPAFASFGVFNNEYERNDLFMKIIKDLK